MAFSNPISNLFGKSPIKPLQEHMSLVVNCAALLDPFFDAVIGQKWEKASNIFDKIANQENQADELKKQFRLSMPSTLFMPVSRTDLLNILAQQDDIANITKDVCGIVLGREMDIPNALQADFMGFVKSTIETSEKALKAINELDELLETGFTGQEVKFVKKLIRELDAQEQKVDKKERKLRHRLFKLEADMPPVNVMFLYSTIDNVGAIADTAERVGNRLELLLAK
ncbi:TIGR00153 family protein [SAR92 clade bacterium H921]|jgi:predicted phosphate transport protein (TIGR00153 family)|nr:TIGR00153 family protein [SAR92 clade bacterium H921]MDG0972001.1 TIGR00153 family protein [Porticoccaceae bacterium]MDG1306603.1 TIGR00153 family protein [Porticoccaceae bacterium]